MPNTLPKPRGNPHAWKPILVAELPISGYLYRATTEGTRVCIQRKKWNYPDEYRSRKAVTMERWEEIVAEVLADATAYQKALILSMLARGTFK